MSIQPFLDASPLIQIHAACAVTAVVTGPFALYGRRDRLHKILGYVWVVAMGAAAMSSFGIRAFAVIGPFSPIHLLAVLALWSLYHGMAAIFRRDIATHRQTMRSLYWNGLMIAALFNFLPGRAVNRTFFADSPENGLFVIALGGAVLLFRVLRGRVQKQSFA